MEKYLSQLLDDQNRVIIPDFGAIIVKQKKPRQLIFNEFLQYNDGALIGLVSKSEGIDRDEAAKKVADYAVELKRNLKSDKSQVLKNIGILVMNSSGKLALEEEGSIKADAKEVKVEQPAATAKPESDKSQPLEIEEEPKLKKDNDPVIKPPEKKPEPITARKPEFQKPQPTATRTTSATSAPPFKAKPTPVEQYYGKNQNSRLNIIIWVIIIVVVNALIIGYFIFRDDFSRPRLTEERISEEFQTSPEVDVPDAQPEESDIQEIFPEVSESDKTPVEKETQEIAIQQEQPKSSVVQPQITGTRYYVVAGVFRDEGNANNLRAKLRSEGYNAEKFGKIGNLHAVSYDVFRNRADADQYLLKIKKEVDAAAWIKAMN